MPTDWDVAATFVLTGFQAYFLFGVWQWKRSAVWGLWLTAAVVVLWNLFSASAGAAALSAAGAAVGALILWLAVRPVWHDFNGGDGGGTERKMAARIGGPTWVCPSCKSPNDSAARYCCDCSRRQPRHKPDAASKVGPSAPRVEKREPGGRVDENLDGWVCACGTANRPTAKHCKACGKRKANSRRVCKRCASVSDRDARFCDECGTDMGELD